MSTEDHLTHIDKDGEARMVDVSGKPETLRKATATGLVSMRSETLALITEGKIPKGDVLAAARIAGVMAAKRTPDLIPLCHPIALTHVSVHLEAIRTKGCTGLAVTATAECVGRTGVEMEALTAASVAALTVYDMCKAVDRGMHFEVALTSKEGGTSGKWVTTEEGS